MNLVLSLSAVCAVALASHAALAADNVDQAAATGVSRNADNSKVNQRDQAAKAVTADEQSNSEKDTEVTRSIRQALVKDDSLSTYAHNIKVITVNGAVTLKGPVKSAAEKSKAESLAKAIAGVSNVDNQLSVKR